jgi:hypothetical protein
MDENSFSDSGSGTTQQQICLTSAAQQFLNQTRPWVRFISVMTFIAAGIMAIAGIVMIAIGIGKGFPGIPSSGVRGPLLGAMGNVAGGFFYIVLAFAYIAPGIFLSRCAGAISLLDSTRSPQALEDAMRNQRSFWRYVGILMIIGLILGVILAAFATIAALLLLSRRT